MVITFSCITKETTLDFAISDLGATFGEYGKFNLPIIKLIGTKNRPHAFSKSKFIKNVKDGRIRFAFVGSARTLYSDITIAQARWVTGLLRQLSDSQIRDAFRAANYSQDEIEIFTNAVTNRVRELDSVTSSSSIASTARPVVE